METKELTKPDLFALSGEPVVINQDLRVFRRHWALDTWTDKNGTEWTPEDLHAEFAPLYLVESTSHAGIEDLRVALFGGDGCDGEDCEGSRSEHDAICQALAEMGVLVPVVRS